MTKQLAIQYKQFLLRKDRKGILKRHFTRFLPEVVFRTTKIENPEVTRSQIWSHL